MLKSSKCNLYDKSEKELAKLNECPLDPGGYFGKFVIKIKVKSTRTLIFTQNSCKRN